MSHPFADHRQSKVEKSRVGHITKRYASGGAVNRTEDDRKVRKMSATQEREVDAEGGVARHRMDRPKRAKGGKVNKGGGKTVVNVITSPPGPVQPPAIPAAGIAPAAMPPAAPRPAMAAPPQSASPASGGMPPQGMPLRAKGGRVKMASGGNASPAAKELADAYAIQPWYSAAAQAARESAGKSFVSSTRKASGGRVNAGTKVFQESRRAGTQVTHDNGHSDLPDMNRKKVVTFASGGRVRTFEASDKIAPATKLPGGSGGGEGRLAKAHRAARK